MTFEEKRSCGLRVLHERLEVGDKKKSVRRFSGSSVYQAKQDAPKECACIRFWFVLSSVSCTYIWNLKQTRIKKKLQLNIFRRQQTWTTSFELLQQDVMTNLIKDEEKKKYCDELSLLEKRVKTVLTELTIT